MMTDKIQNAVGKDACIGEVFNDKGSFTASRLEDAQTVSDLHRLRYCYCIDYLAEELVGAKPSLARRGGHAKT